MHKPDPDLNAAVEFVIDRISDEAARVGAPLTDEEKGFLRDLPRRPTNLTFGWMNLPGEGVWPMPPIRDFSFEGLCALAKNAHSYDLETRPGADVEWKFAGAVLQVNHHPMAWILNWAGMKTRARWSRLLTACCATLIVVLSALGALATSLLLRGEQGLSFTTICIVCGVAIAAALVFSYIAMQRIDRWLERRAVERYRCALPFGTSTVNSPASPSSPPARQP